MDPNTLRGRLLADVERVRDAVFAARSDDPAFIAVAADALVKRIADLKLGRAVWLYRGALPDDHPERHAGDPRDWFMLTEDDRLLAVVDLAAERTAAR